MPNETGFLVSCDMVTVGTSTRQMPAEIHGLMWDKCSCGLCGIMWVCTVSGLPLAGVVEHSLHRGF